MSQSSETPKFSNEQPSSPQAMQEHLEKLEKSFSHEIEALLMHAEIANTGTQGIIFRIRNGDIAPELLHFMQEQGIHFGKNDAAMKVLKIYQQGKGEAEYESLMRAHQALRNAPMHPPKARVPEPLFFQTLTLEPETVQYLNSAGARLTGSHAEAFCMEFIPGKDIATLIYEYVLRSFGFDDHTIGLMPFEELHAHVAQRLDFRAPGGKGKTESERIHEEYKLEEENFTKKLIPYLKKRGFSIAPGIVQKIAHTIEILHAHDIFHNDLHERNIMLDKDYQSGDADTDVTFVDFGLSKKGSQAELKTMSDEAVVERLKLLNTSEIPARERHAQMLEKLYVKTQSERVWQTFIQTLKEAGKDARKRILSNAFAMYSADEHNCKKFESVLLAVGRENEALKKDIVDFFHEELTQERARKKKMIRGFLLQEIELLVSLLK